MLKLLHRKSNKHSYSLFRESIYNLHFIIIFMDRSVNFKIKNNYLIKNPYS